MKTIKQKVIETRTYTVTYYVRAEDPHEAADKIAIGDTIREEDERLDGVRNREPFDVIEEVIPRTSDAARKRKTSGSRKA